MLPGQVPIFIIAPFSGIANDLAVLLSGYIQPAHHYHKLPGVINHDNNYFYNQQLANSLLVNKELGGQQLKERQDKIKLLVDEGMNNGKQWGLIADYEAFFHYKLDTLYKKAYYIFLYDEPSGNTHHDSAYFLKEVMSFYTEHTACSLVLHANQISQLPEQILSSLPLDKAQVAVKEYRHSWKEMAESLDTEDFNTLEAMADPSTLILTQELNHHNWLTRNKHWFEGDEITAVYLLEDTTGLKMLREKLLQLTRAFINMPQVMVLCASEEDQQQVLSFARMLNLTLHVEAGAITPAAINALLRQAAGQYILVDRLHHHYTLPDVLKVFIEKRQPAFSFARISQGKNNKNNRYQLQLADILTTHILEDNLAFPYIRWQQVNGFDERLQTDVALWDISIRMLELPETYATEATAVLPLNTIPAGSKELFKSPGYQQIISKHRAVFEKSLNQVIQLVALKQHLPQDEIRNLQEQIASLQALLMHSKDEYKALNKYSVGLAERVQALEGRWYFKLGRKLKHFKNIFFKEKSSGKGTLKRILEFLSFTFSKPGFRIVRKVVKGALKKMYLLAETRPVQIVYLDVPTGNNIIQTYHDWIKVKTDKDAIKKEYDQQRAAWTHEPKISIIMPVYNPPAKFLKQAIESVIAQMYTNWELCIADDCSPDPQIRKLLNAYSAKDRRIKVEFRTENGHISACSNSALKLATGEYILLMDHDDLLTMNCLSEVVDHLNKNPENEIVYSDEDKIDENDLHSMPHFKSDWAPHSLMSRNYFGHVVVISKRIMDQVNGFRIGFEGSQDYDLLLRATEVSQKIGHIPKVLYHWRIHEASAAQSEEVKPYAYIAAKKALEEAMVRRNTPGEVQYLSGLRGYRIRYKVTHPGKVSIIIPTKDQVKLLKNTIDSILQRTDYPDYEIIILNNNSSSKEFFSFMREYCERYAGKVSCVDANFPFNFARLMNIGVKLSRGEYLLFLNNDVEVIHEDWITQMVSYAQQPHTGTVGVKLLYPDDNIQHAGVVVGLGGVAGHAFVNFHKHDAGYFNYIQSVNNYSALTAACLMCRKSVYEELGGMDESFEVEYNDVDLCLNFQKAGYYNVYLPDVELYHYESATRGHPHQSKESWERHVREIALFKSKWQHIIDRDPYYNPNLNLGVHDFSLNFSA